MKPVKLDWLPAEDGSRWRLAQFEARHVHGQIRLFERCLGDWEFRISFRTAEQADAWVRARLALQIEL
jgi:hypothetical protein